MQELNCPDPFLFNINNSSGCFIIKRHLFTFFSDEDLQHIMVLYLLIH